MKPFFDNIGQNSAENDEEEEEVEEDEEEEVEEEEEIEDEEEIEEEEESSKVLSSSNNVERRFASIVQGMKLSNLETGELNSLTVLSVQSQRHLL